MKPLMIELFAGLHGWGEGGVAVGFRVVGFDIVDMCKELGRERPKGIDLVIQDVLTLHGSQFKEASLIVASPPCQAYSYRAMPWKRAKALPPPDNSLFEACFRIREEAEAAWLLANPCPDCGLLTCDAVRSKRRIPLIVENVRGAQKWVGRSAWNFGSFHLWGDVPALMPIPYKAQKFNPDGTARPSGSWFAIADSKNRGARMKSNPGTHERLTGPGRFIREGTKQSEISGTRNNGKGDRWFQDAATFGSKSNSRRAASAEIAKIPFPLALHIAKTFKPDPLHPEFKKP